MKKRKEVSLNKSVIDKLSLMAEKKNRNLKNYMEEVLIEHADKKGRKGE